MNSSSEAGLPGLTGFVVNRIMGIIWFGFLFCWFGFFFDRGGVLSSGIFALQSPNNWVASDGKLHCT